MSIISELERLSALRDRGDLSDEEFDKAKAIVLSGKNEMEPASDETESAKGTAFTEAPEELTKRKKTHFLVGVFATIAAVFSAVSVVLDPSKLQIVIFVIWVLASVAGWSTYSKLKRELENYLPPIPGS